MAAANTDKFIKVAPNTGWQVDASGISDASVTSFGLVSATSIPTDTAVILTIDRVDSSGNMTPAKMERIVGVMSGATVTSCVRGLEGTAQSHAAGAVVEVVISKSNINKLMEGVLVEHNQDGTHKKLTGLDTDTFISQKNAAGSGNINLLKVNANNNILGGDALTILKLALPQGGMINGKIVPSVAANNLTVALKTLAGTDPSSADPVYVRIGDTVRPIIAALSVTLNAATNWFAAGSADLAAKEVDYFVYLAFRASDSSVVMFFSRRPGETDGASVGTVTTGEFYGALSGGANLATGDYCELIGRFAATLSAGAGFTWTVPAYTAANLIQRPIYETRWLNFAPTFAGWSANPTLDWATYRLQHNALNVRIGCSAGTSNATTATVTIPFAVLNFPVGTMLAINAGAILATPAKWSGTPGSTVLTLYKDCANAAWTNSGAKSFLIENMVIAV